jgi:hypothetical protein
MPNIKPISEPHLIVVSKAQRRRTKLQRSDRLKDTLRKLNIKARWDLSDKTVLLRLAFALKFGKLFLRGTDNLYDFSPDKFGYAEAYFINPLSGNSIDWAGKLKATIYAAIDRALVHSKTMRKDSQHLDLDSRIKLYYPELRVYYDRSDLFTYLEEQKHRSHRDYYEVASVDGKSEKTFPESTISERNALSAFKISIRPELLAAFKKMNEYLEHNPQLKRARQNYLDSLESQLTSSLARGQYIREIEKVLGYGHIILPETTLFAFQPEEFFVIELLKKQVYDKFIRQLLRSVSMEYETLQQYNSE